LRGAYPVWREIGTRWADNDAYGHVNNTVHYAWFDTAVNGWLIEAGLLDVAAGDPIGLVVERLGTSSVTYRIGIFAKGSEMPAAEGHFTHVYVGRDSRRPAELPG